jgi:NADPH:quinone reductase
LTTRQCRLSLKGMRAWLMDDFNGIGGLRLAELPDPVPQSHEVVLRVRYAALNPADRYLAENQYPAKPALPHILGRDGMGTVVQAGSEVTGVRVGDRRTLLRGEAGVNQPGTFAQFVAVLAQDLVEVPTGWTEPEAAGATTVYLTAYQALTMWGPLPPSAVVLVTGASGGVGVATAQLAAAMGYKVLALSRSPEKSRRLEQLGAAATFNPEDPNWSLKLRNALTPNRVDLAIDNIGGKLLPHVINTLGDLGRVSLVGRLAGPVPNFNTAALFFRRIRMGGVAVGAWTNAESRAAWSEVLSLLARSGARPQVDQIFKFEQLPQAFERLAQGPMGKVLVEVQAAG